MKRLALAVLLLGTVPTLPSASSGKMGTVPHSTSPLDPVWLQSFDAAWRIINSTYYDPKFNGVDWEAVRRELRPRAEAAASPDEVRTVIRDMIGRLRDSHFMLLPEGAGPSDKPLRDLSGDLGIDLRYLDDEPVVVRVEEGSAAAVSGVQPGWILRSVDGEPIRPAVARAAETAGPRLGALEAWRIITERVRGPIGSTAHLSLVDGNGSSREIRIERRAETGQPVTLGTFPTLRVRTAQRSLRAASGAEVGYVRFNVWLTPVDGVVARAVDEHRDAQGMIVDLRGNPGGLAAMLMGIAGQFIADRVSLGEMRSRDGTLQFFANPRAVSPDGRPVKPFAGRVAILIDRLTGSASECFAGGMQSIGRARIFGEASMGQALPALFDKLPSGDVLVHAYADFVTAKGTRIEGTGVVPDVRVEWSRADLL
ncbi:MAG: S41 family peptidase, partial [Acidobacteriota bacterium]